MQLHKLQFKFERWKKKICNIIRIILPKIGRRSLRHLASSRQEDEIRNCWDAIMA